MISSRITFRFNYLERLPAGASKQPPSNNTLTGSFLLCFVSRSSITVLSPGGDRGHSQIIGRVPLYGVQTIICSSLSSYAYFFDWDIVENRKNLNPSLIDSVIFAFDNGNVI